MGRKLIYLTEKGNLSYLSGKSNIIKKDKHTLQRKFKGLSILDVLPFFVRAVKTYQEFVINSEKVFSFPSTDYFFVSDLMGILEKAI